MTETSTLAQLWFALQIHEAMDLQGNPRQKRPAGF
jgi:purine catabolism regulator